jgi:hypothetical protein
MVVGTTDKRARQNVAATRLAECFGRPFESYFDPEWCPGSHVDSRQSPEASPGSGSVVRADDTRSVRATSAKVEVR